MNASIVRIGLLVLVALVTPLAVRGASPKTMLREINRFGLKTPVTLPTRTVAGHYASDPHLTGDDLYLFPDGRFLYLQWGCLEPHTIHARGWWSIRDGFVEMTSDGKIPDEDGPRDARYLPLATGNTKQPMMLMGAGWDYRYFRQNAAGGRPDSMLTVCTKKRVESIPPAGGAALYRKLMRESWRLAYFAPAVTGRP